MDTPITIPDMDPLEAATNRVEERARCKRDKFFLSNMLGYDFQECHAELFAAFPSFDPSKPWLEQSEIKDMMILWSRGHYKSTAVIVCAIQAVLNFPNLRVLLMQGSIPVTKLLLKQIMAHFTGQALGSRFRELFPEFCGEKRELHGTQMSFTTCARTALQLPQATFTVASPKSVKSGQHYDLGLFDDLVNDQNFRSPTLVEKVREDFTLASSLIDPGCYRWVSGTRYTFGDLYETILRWQTKSGKWIVSVKDCWTDGSAALPDILKIPRFPRFTKRSGERGGFTTEELLQMQEDDISTFACQYLNKPIHSSKLAFTEEILNDATIAKDSAPYLGNSVLMIDLATGQSDHADDSVIICGRIDSSGVGYAVDMRGDVWAPLELANNVVDMVLRHRPVRVFLENSASGQVFEAFLKMIATQKRINIPVEMVKVDFKPDAKNMRVMAFAGIVKKKRFLFFKGLSRFDRLIEQAITFPKGRFGHDDYPDCCALLYQQLCKEIVTMPFRSASAKDPIMALIHDRENAMIKVLTEDERDALSGPDQTGLMDLEGPSSEGGPRDDYGDIGEF
jgi:hypothetical protein